ncbi:MAG: CvpA family protein [Clostridia bacterium]|nr:CvpA family protein [Clostridia bacterium]
MNVVDIIIIAIVLIFIIVGACRGFIFSVLSLFGGTVNIFLAMILSSPVSSLVKTMGITGTIKAGYVGNFASNTNFTTALSSIEAEQLPSFITKSVNNSNISGLGKTLTKWFLKISPQYVENHPEATLSDVLSTAYSNFWTTVIAFGVSLLAIYFVLLLVSVIAKKMKQSKAINTGDRIFGIVFGAIRGAIYVCTLLLIISLISSTGILTVADDYISESKIGSWLYQIVCDFSTKYITNGNLLALFGR